MGPVGIGACGEKGDKGDTAGVVQRRLVGPQGSTDPRDKVLKDYVELLVSKVLLEYKNLFVLLVENANMAQKETKVFKVLLELKAIVVNEVNMV